MVSTRANMPPPPQPPELGSPAAPIGARLTAPLNDMDEDLVRLNSVLDWLEAHGDDDAFSMVSMMRPFATSLGNHLDGLRVAAHAPPP